MYVKCLKYSCDVSEFNKHPHNNTNNLNDHRGVFTHFVIFTLLRLNK